MDPNALVEAILLDIYNANKLAEDGYPRMAAETWGEIADKVEDMREHLRKGGFPPTLPFNFQIFETN